MFAPFTVIGRRKPLRYASRIEFLRAGYAIQPAMMEIDAASAPSSAALGEPITAHTLRQQRYPAGQSRALLPSGERDEAVDAEMAPADSHKERESDTTGLLPVFIDVKARHDNPVERQCQRCARRPAFAAAGSEFCFDCIVTVLKDEPTETELQNAIRILECRVRANRARIAVVAAVGSGCLTTGQSNQLAEVYENRTRREASSDHYAAHYSLV